LTFQPESLVVPPEVPSLGLHPSISGGSSCLELKKDPRKGRFVVTNQGTTCLSSNPATLVQKLMQRKIVHPSIYSGHSNDWNHESEYQTGIRISDTSVSGIHHSKYNNFHLQIVPANLHWSVH
jgi:hypothetical protein